MPGNQLDIDQLSELLKSHKETGDREPLIEAKKIVKENQIDMSNEMTSEIRRFIDKSRSEKFTERAIRRMVKRKFGIIVLPK
jgi:Ni,Fe-hydrogenase maturation factor